jgi:hypothetical protein
MVESYFRTVAGRWPAVPTFREHFLFVVADDLRTLSGLSVVLSGQRPRPEMLRSPVPIEPGTPKRDAHIAGGHALVYADTTAQGRGLRASGWGKAKVRSPVA